MDTEQSARRDLAVAFRFAARLKMHEATANHFSVVVSQDSQNFLINPAGRHFSLVRASELILVDLNAKNLEITENSVACGAVAISSGTRPERHGAIPEQGC